MGQGRPSRGESRLHYTGAMTTDHTSLDQLSTPLALLDAELSCLHFNPALQVLLGTGWRRLIGMPLSLFCDDPTPLQQAAKRCLQQLGPTRMLDLQLTLPAERHLRLSAVLSPYLDREDTALVLECVPLRTLDDTSDWFEGQSALTAVLKGFVHELRNPLGGIRGAAQILRRSAQDEASVEFSEIIMAEADRLGALSDRLLSPGLPRQTEPVNIHRLLERIRQLVDAEDDHQVLLERDYDPSLPSLHGDPDRLLQALLNIVRNAVQCGASTVRLRTRAEHHLRLGERVHKLAMKIEIIDDGPGIPAALESTLFLPFVSGRAGGTGLGLSMARAAIHEHGGILSVDSRPGDTRFIVVLPLESEHG